MLEISAPSNISGFRVEWQSININIPSVCNNTVCSAEVMLPAKYELSGYFPLKVAAVTQNGLEITAAVDQRVADKKYPAQSLTVDPAYVNLSNENAMRASRETELIRAALQTFSETRKWAIPFQRPVPGIVTGVFGEERTFNGEPRSRHGGVDLRGAAGDTIYAAADGTVILTGNYYFSGNCVYLDHGQGVITSYMHMSKISVKQGDAVKAGQALGLVGATGRVTGPHLHFGLNVQGVSVDAMGLF